MALHVKQEIIKHFKNIHISSRPQTIRSGTSQKAFPTGKSEETKAERNQTRDKTEPCFPCDTLGSTAGQVPELQAEVQMGWCLPQHGLYPGHTEAVGRQHKQE